MTVRVDIQIDHSAPQAPYDQLRRQIIAQVRDGRLIAGSKIPTVRALAADVGLAPNTVAKAYRQLSEVGVIETRGKQGTFIASSGDATRTRAQRTATTMVGELRRLGLGDDEVLALVGTALRGA